MESNEKDRLESEARISILRADYTRARRELARAETIHKGTYGSVPPGSPILAEGSLADVARQFIVRSGGPLSYKQIRALLELESYPYTPGRLKKALKAASRHSKKQVLRWVNNEDFRKVVDEDDLFEAF